MTRDKFPKPSAVEVVITWQNWVESSCDDDSKCETFSSFIILYFHMLCEILESVKVGKGSEQGKWSHKHRTLEAEGPLWATQSLSQSPVPRCSLDVVISNWCPKNSWFCIAFPHLVFLSSVNGFAFWPKLEV